MTSPRPAALMLQLPATIVAIASYVIVAGIFTQSGVILGPAAAYFHTDIADTAALFSYVNAGNLGGVFAALFAFPTFTIRRLLFVAYAVFFAGVGLMVLSRSLETACAAAVLIGLGTGAGLSAGAVIIAKIYADRLRALAFLVTDCAFSITGYVVPSLVGIVLAARWGWQSGYVLVSIIPVLLIAAALAIRFPAVGRSATSGSAPEPAVISRSSYRRAGLFAAALALAFTGQNVFTIWAPTVLQVQFDVPVSQADGIVATFFAASSFGLVTAALLVSILSPRAILTWSITLGTILTLLLTLAPTAGLFFGLTCVFGFTSTCMYKLMISIGSEQIASSPPRLVTLLVLCAGLGGIVAPAISAPIVKLYGTHASLYLCCAAYALALSVVIVALLVERSAREEIPADVLATAG